MYTEQIYLRFVRKYWEVQLFNVITFLFFKFKQNLIWLWLCFLVRKILIAITTWRSNRNAPSSTWMGWRQTSWRVRFLQYRIDIQDKWRLFLRRRRRCASKAPLSHLWKQIHYNNSTFLRKVKCQLLKSAKSSVEVLRSNTTFFTLSIS